MGKRKNSGKNQVPSDGTPKMQEQSNVVIDTPTPKKRKKKRGSQ